jgi:anti-sigma regulatory factor (Ser/Thr protein kinase)
MGSATVRSGARVVDMRLPATPEAVAAARHGLAPLQDVLTPDRLDDVRLLVSELVTNSLRHGSLGPGDEVELTVDLHDRAKVRVAVRDPGTGFALGVRPSDGTVTQGLGLYLLSQLAEAWSITVDGDTSIWFDVSAR